MRYNHDTEVSSVFHVDVVECRIRKSFRIEDFQSHSDISRINISVACSGPSLILSLIVTPTPSV